MRDIINTTTVLENIICHDEGDGWGSAEPYLWTVFFKIDGTTVRLNDSLNLEGTASVETTPGSHGNLGDTDVDEGDTLNIPSAIGFWQTTLFPIPVPDFVKNLGTDDIAAVAGVICILMEEDNVSDSGANAGHTALNNAVQSALDSVIGSLGVNHPEITQADIDAMSDAIQSKVTNAVKDSQNIFENIWSWLNSDDTIGTKVFFFNQDDLIANGTTTLHQRWDNEGDWEINGKIDASVACTANALKAAAEIFGALFSSSSQQKMQEFKKKQWHHYKKAQQWWQLGERNMPLVLEQFKKQPELLERSLRLQRSIEQILNNPEEKIPTHFWKEGYEIISTVLKENNQFRKVRKDLSRVLDMIELLQDKSFNETLTILNMIEPARHPKMSGPIKIKMSKKEIFSGVKKIPGDGRKEAVS